MVLDVLAVVAFVAGNVVGGYLGWQLGVHSEAAVRKTVEDVEKGQLGDAKKDATGK